MSDRYRGLRPHPEALGVVLLNPGEKSQPVRIRAPEQVHVWLNGMSALQIGNLLGEMMNTQSIPTTARTERAERVKLAFTVWLTDESEEWTFSGYGRTDRTPETYRELRRLILMRVPELNSREDKDWQYDYSIRR